MQRTFGRRLGTDDGPSNRRKDAYLDQRLLRRWRIISIVAAMLPFQLFPQLRGSGDSPTAFATTILLILFIGAVLWRFFRLRELLQEIDPATVRFGKPVPP